MVLATGFNVVTHADIQIKAAGIPINGIDIAEGTRFVNYRDEATPEQRAQGDQILADVLADPAAAQAAWETEQAGKITTENATPVVMLFAQKLNAAGISVTQEEIAAAMGLA
jgi:hypothetical protein